MVTPVCAGELSLRLGADRADDGRAQRAQPLTGDEAYAAGRCVQQDDMTLTDREGPSNEVFHRAALEHDRGRGLLVDPVRKRNQPRAWHYPAFTVRSCRAVSGVRDRVTRREVANALADHFDAAGAFHPGCERQLEGV